VLPILAAGEVSAAHRGRYDVNTSIARPSGSRNMTW
jgi:hypothetical protein